jgi:outer membrane lipoprotein carrier protein
VTLRAVAFLGAAFLLAASFVDASEPSTADRVWQAYEKRWSATESYAADFKQKIEISGIGGEVESSGRFYFRRPDLMRWDYLQGQQQTVVGDGEWIWVYQPDLEQAYRVAYAEAFGTGGLVALLAGREGLSAKYRTTLLDENSEIVRIRLEPAGEVGETLDLTMSADTMDLRSVVVTDPAGSVTIVEFSDPKRNGPLQEGLFEFEPPAGVDVIAPPAG